MNTSNPSSFLVTLALIAGQLVYCGIASTAIGSPAAEVSRAFKIASSTSSNPLSPKPFLQAWRAVISGADENSVRVYVSEAIRLRPDSCAAIVESTLSILIPPKQLRLTQRDLFIIRETITGALEAQPGCAASVVTAAIRVQPSGRDAIVAAALLAAPGEKEAIAEAAALRSTLNWIKRAQIGHDDDDLSFDALNPSNIDARLDRVATVVSPEKEPE